MKIWTAAPVLTALLLACSSELEQSPKETASTTGTEKSEMVAAEAGDAAVETGTDEGPSEKAEPASLPEVKYYVIGDG